MGKATNVATPSSAFRESPHKKRPKTIKIRLNPGKIARTVTSRSSHQDEASHASRQSPPLLEPVSSSWHLEYDINRLLGEGAFGKVYEARRVKDSCLVALKIINVDSVTNTALERELNAMRILSNPGHEHICSLYDQYQDNSKFIISMEHISGEELFEHLVSKGSFSEREASNFLCQCAEGLQYIHEKKMIHGDLKPENLMMCSNGNVKIVDFGCCVEEGASLIFGTIAYLSPEVLLNFPVPQVSSTSVDVWAFGVIMFIMLTGRHPFDATNVASDDVIRQNIINTLSDHDDSIFVNLEGLSMSSINLMKRLLNADPKHRIGVSEFLDDCWCQNTAPKTCLQNCEELREFNAKAKRRFKAAVSTIIAVHKLKSLR